jgi:uncharacterized protein (TIGR02996 family)
MARNPELEAAIVADPEAEGPYVVYGDWLQGQGDPRGELIAVQLALETARGARWAELKHRELRILREHHGALVGGAAPLFCDWRRGFVDRVDAEPIGGEVLAHPSLALVRAVSGAELAGIQRANPPLLVELGIRHHAMADLLAMPGLRRLRMAETRPRSKPVAPRPARSGLEALALDGLETYDFVDCAFPALRAVRSRWNGDDERVATQLAFVAATGAELDLTLDDDAPVAALEADPAGARRITTLRLDYVPAERAAAIRRLMTGVRRLELVGDRTGPALSLADVAALPAERLTDLRVSRALIDRQVCAALVGLPCAPALASLAIEIHDRGVFAALCRGRFPALRRLALDGIERIAIDQFDELADAVPALDELVVYQHQLPVIAASRLAGRLRTLTVRGLGRMTLTRRSLPALAAFARLERLRVVGFEQLGPDTIDAFAAFGVAVEVGRHVTDRVTGD